MRERTRRHDDAHRPMGGKGKRATPRKHLPLAPRCQRCGRLITGNGHLCNDQAAIYHGDVDGDGSLA